MDVLKPKPRLCRLIPWLAGLAVWLTAAACLNLTGPGAGTVPRFPHDVHVVDKQLGCTFCHPRVRADERPGFPPPELCAPCHDDIDRDKPADRRVAAFYGPDSRFLRELAAPLSPEIRFSHRQHVTGARLECSECHGRLDAPRAATDRGQRKTDCMSCHQRSGAPNECATCHTTIDRHLPPPSHDGGWAHLHGHAVLSGDPAIQNRCGLCHDEPTSCQACHQRQPPRDHTNQFRLRGHGLAASFDRARCATCHTRDSCEQCHQETRPLSHRGGFGAPADRHCTSCHFPLQDNGCATCHRSTPGHLAATPLPGDHHPAMNCRHCHGNGVALPHPDGGHACTQCHR